MKIPEVGGGYNSKRAPRSSNAYINGGRCYSFTFKTSIFPFPLIFLQDYTYR